jgi:hypothetical protein
MKTEAFVETGEQVRAGLSELAGSLKEFSGDLKDRWDDTRQVLGRRARRIRTAAEDGLADARRTIKSHPLTFVAGVASAAFVLGALAGYAACRNSRR